MAVEGHWPWRSWCQVPSSLSSWMLQVGNEIRIGSEENRMGCLPGFPPGRPPPPPPNRTPPKLTEGSFFPKNWGFARIDIFNRVIHRDKRNATRFFTRSSHNAVLLQFYHTHKATSRSTMLSSGKKSIFGIWVRIVTRWRCFSLTKVEKKKESASSLGPSEVEVCCSDEKLLTIKVGRGFRCE